MPAEEQVVIKIDVKSNLAKDRAEMEAFFQSIRRESKLLEADLNRVEKRQDSLAKKFDKTEKSGNKMSRMFTKMGKAFKTAGGAAAKFFSVFGKFSFIATAIEIGLVGAALLSVKLIMVGSRFAVQAYQAALSGLGVAAGGVAVALGSVAAAMREMQEVQLAPWVGGLRNATLALRNTFNDDMVSFFGMEGIQGAVTALAKGGVDASSGYTQILRRLGDFTPDPKELSELAKAYASIKKSGIIDDQSFSTLGKINPTLTAGIGELTGLDSEALGKAISGGDIDESVFEALLSGKASSTDAFEGQLARLNSTVIGQLKGMIPRLFQQFAALGQPFLKSIWTVLNQVEDIIERSITRIRTTVTGFGLDAMLPGFIDMFQKFNDWMVVLINSSLPKVEGWINSMDGFVNKMKGWFRGIANIFKPLEEGADILWDMLKNMFGPFFDGFGGLVKGLNQLLIDNKAGFLAFGTAFGGVFSAIMEWFGNANTRFAESLPVWTELLNVIADDFIPILGTLFDLMHEATMTILPAITSGLSAIAPAITAVANAIAQLMKIPGIGALLAMAMLPGFLGGGLVRGGMAMAGRGIAGGVGMATGGMSMSGMLGTGVAAAGGGSAMLGAGVLGGAGLAGGVIGTVAGDHLSGGRGLLAGAGGGALAGAAIGAFGGPIGAAAGALVGGLAGAIGAHLAHGRKNKEIEKAAAAFYETWLEAHNEKLVARYEAQAETRTRTLAQMTGKTNEEIAELASTLNLDLGNAVTSVTDQMKAMGELSDFDFTLEGSQDISTNSFLDAIMGEGSLYEEKYRKPELANDADAALQNFVAAEANGGASSADFEAVVQGINAFVQTGYGNTGSALSATYLNESAELDRRAGGGTRFQDHNADVRKGLVGRVTDSTDMTALLASITDSLSYLKDSPEKTARIDSTFETQKSELMAIATSSNLATVATLDDEIQRRIGIFTGTDIESRNQQLALSFGELETSVETLSGVLVEKAQAFLTSMLPGPTGTDGKPLSYRTMGNENVGGTPMSQRHPSIQQNDFQITDLGYQDNSRATISPRITNNVQATIENAPKVVGDATEASLRNSTSRSNRGSGGKGGHQR